MMEPDIITDPEEYFSKVRTDKLQAIEARARALGWEWESFFGAVTAIVDMLHYPDIFSLDHPLWLEAAERLLTAYEPVTGPVVVIKQVKWDGPPHYTCDIDCGMPLKCPWSIIEEGCFTIPGPQCPGPGTYRLVRCDDKEDK